MFEDRSRLRRELEERFRLRSASYDPTSRFRFEAKPESFLPPTSNLKLPTIVFEAIKLLN